MRFPASMATQHPDSASRYVPVQEEVDEAVSCLTPSPEGLGCEEYMVDYEGKMTPYHQTAQLVSRLSSEGLEPGEDVFVTPRIPSASEENVFRQLMTLLSVVEANFGSGRSSIVEVVHPMTKSAEELMETRRRIEQTVKLASDGGEGLRGKEVDLIPLVEGVPHLLDSGRMMERYVELSRDELGLEIDRLRVMLGRSDPALHFGMAPAVLSNKLAVAGLHEIEGVEVGPIFGGGYLPFRGHVSEENVEQLAEEFAGIRTATVQSGIRYDRGEEATRKLTEGLRKHLPDREPLRLSEEEKEFLINTSGRFATAYLPFLYAAARQIGRLADLIPSQRDRLTRTGEMGYSRDVPEAKRMAELCTDEELKRRLSDLQKERMAPIPRAISYTAALYTIGLPPEFIGSGRGLESLGDDDFERFLDQYGSFRQDVEAAAPFLNLENASRFLPREALELARRDVDLLREYFDLDTSTERGLYSLLGETMRPILEEVLSGESEIIVDGEAERELLTNWILRLGEMRGSLG